MPTTVPVTADNFTRAETDMCLGMLVKRGGGVGHFDHLRQLHSIEGSGVRPNRDTLYSEAVFDLDAGPVEITLPDPGDRFLSMLVIDQDHYAVTVVYGGGRHILTRDQVGTRYVFAAVRILVDPDDPSDVEQVHALQDQIIASQPSSGSFEVPSWDQASQKQVRDALLSLSSTLPDLRGWWEPSGGGSGPASDRDRGRVWPQSRPGRRLPERDSQRQRWPAVHRLTVTDVPVDGFWSISVYDAEGHFVKNDRDAYTLNSVTARRAPDGSVVVQFGGCEDQVANCLPIFPGWNYMVRLYRPRPEVLDGTWTFPEAEPVT